MMIAIATEICSKIIYDKYILPVCICWSTAQISIPLNYITRNKTVKILVIKVQCSTRFTEHSTSVQITSKLFSSPVLHFVPRKIFTRILYTVL